MARWVGSYRAKGGQGLYPLIRHDGGLIAGEPERSIANASFAVRSARQEVIYVVDECEQGRIAAWRRTERGWNKLSDLSSGGSLPCYLSLSSNERWLACANYGDGAVTLFRLDRESGAILEMVDAFQPSGSGADPERQDGPHAHCVLFEDDDRALYHVDLGLDRVFRHRLDEGRIAASSAVFRTEAGAGPRHLVFHPDRMHALLICELSAQLLLLRREGEGFACVQVVPTCPETIEALNLGGHLMVDEAGDVLVTNRGHDSLVRFVLRDGTLAMSDWCSTGGASPRHMARHGAAWIVAHETSGGVTQVESGRLPLQIADVPGAAFILDLPSDGS